MTFCQARKSTSFLTTTVDIVCMGLTHGRICSLGGQLLCHCISVEVYRELLEADRSAGLLTDLRKAAYVYLSLSLDKLLNYNSRMTRWIVPREVMAGTFDRHNFSLNWACVEMAPLLVGHGYDWVIEQTAKCIKELVELVRPEEAAAAKLTAKAQKHNAKGAELFITSLAAMAEPAYTLPSVTITCKSGDHLDQGRRTSECETNSYFYGYGKAVWHTNSNDRDAFQTTENHSFSFPVDF